MVARVTDSGATEAGAWAYPANLFINHHQNFRGTVQVILQVFARPVRAPHLGKSQHELGALLNKYPGLKSSYWSKGEKMLWLENQKDWSTWLEVCIASTYSPSVLDITWKGCLRKGLVIVMVGQWICEHVCQAKNLDPSRFFAWHRNHILSNSGNCL